MQLPKITFRYVCLMSIAVVVILSSTGTSMDGVASAIVVCTARIISGTIASRSSKWIAVALGGEVIPVCAVGHCANMRLNVCAIAAGVTTDRCRVVVCRAGNAVSNTRYTIAH